LADDLFAFAFAAKTQLISGRVSGGASMSTV
jgi:hypothetical protein